MSESYMASSSKEILIKSLARAISTYVMRVFKLPYSVCDDLNIMMHQYWWGVEKGRRDVG